MSIEYTAEVSEILEKCSECSSNDLEKHIKKLKKLALRVIKENQELRREISILSKRVNTD